MNQQVLDALKDVVADRPNVTSLRLVYKKLGPIEAQWIADAMRKNTNVTLVRLDSNRLGDRGTALLCHALKGNSSVTELNLATNEIYCDGICAAADLLRSNKSITTLKLNHNYIGLRGANAIADMLRVNRTLQQLNISCKSLPLEGVVAIAKALAKNQSLISLHLTGAQVGNKGASAIADALKDNYVLRLLNLSDCGIENDGGVSIANALKSSVKKSNLKSIDLTHNKINESTLERISSLLEQVQAVKAAQKPKEPEVPQAAKSAAASTTRSLLRNMFGLGPEPPKSIVTPAPPPELSKESRPYTQPHSGLSVSGLQELRRQQEAHEARRPQLNPLWLPALSSASSTTSSTSSSRSSIPPAEPLDDAFDVAAAIASKFHSPRGMLGNLRGWSLDSLPSSVASSPSATPRLPPVMSPRQQQQLLQQQQQLQLQLSQQQRPSAPAASVTSPRSSVGPLAAVVSPRSSQTIVVRAESSNVLVSPQPVPPLRRAGSSEYPNGDLATRSDGVALNGSNGSDGRPITETLSALTEANLRRRPSSDSVTHHARPLRKNSKRLSAGSLGNCSSDGEDRRTPASLDLAWDEDGSVDEHGFYLDYENYRYDPVES